MSTSSLVQRSLGPPCPGPAMAAVRVVAGGRGGSYTSSYRDHDRRMLPGTVIDDDTTIGSILSGRFCVVVFKLQTTHVRIEVPVHVN